MAANITDKITSSSDGNRPVSTTVSTLRTTGATTLACADLTGWPTATAVHFVTYQIDGQGDIVAGTQVDWKGIVSGSNITNLTVTGGTDAGNSVGDIVEILPTAAWGKDVTDALLASHNQDGTLKANAVTTTSITNGAVTSSKLGLATNAGSVATAEGTTSTSYTDLATAGPSATATIGSNGLALVIMSGLVAVSASGVTGRMSFEVSGANTVAAADENAKVHTGYASDAGENGAFVRLMTGLTPGSTTFTTKYKTTSGTATFTHRKIAVVAL